MSHTRGQTDGQTDGDVSLIGFLFELDGTQKITTLKSDLQRALLSTNKLSLRLLLLDYKFFFMYSVRKNASQSPADCNIRVVDTYYPSGDAHNMYSVS